MQDIIAEKLRRSGYNPVPLPIAGGNSGFYSFEMRKNKFILAECFLISPAQLKFQLQFQLVKLIAFSTLPPKKSNDMNEFQVNQRKTFLLLEKAGPFWIQNRPLRSCNHGSSSST